jgi:hypothetical protein
MYSFPCEPPTEYHCDALILAFPPTAASLAGFQLDPVEYDVFSRSRHNMYFSSVVKLRDASFVRCGIIEQAETIDTTTLICFRPTPRKTGHPSNLCY